MNEYTAWRLVENILAAFGAGFLFLVLLAAVGVWTGRHLRAARVQQTDRLYRDRMEAHLADEWELREAAERVERGAA